jgi:CRP/FNR family transcriptional regulator, cyclic AMP receptor protein
MERRSVGAFNVEGIMPGPSHQEKRRIIAEHSLLGKLTETEIETLLKFSRVECYPAGEQIIAKDSPGNSMMLVLRGSLKVSSISLGGREIVFNVIDEGEIVGEIAVLDGGPRSCDVVARTDCELLVLNRRDFMPLLEKHADICLMLITILCERLRHTSEQVEDLLFRHAEGRIAKVLLQLSVRFGRREVEERVFELHLSQSELGNMAGITRESVNKTLKAWERAGYVKLAKESIIITHRAALEQVV